MTAVAETPQVEQVEEDVVAEPTKPVGNYFADLASVDVSNYIEKKNGYSYLSWAFAVDQLKRKHPDAIINVKRFPDPEFAGVLVPYYRTGLGYFVEVEVIVNGVSVSEPFPVLDYRNKPIAKPTTMDINNSLQRAKVKMIAGHGLGLYIYAGEDLPIDSDNDANKGSQQGPSYNQPQQFQQQQYQQQQFQQPQVQAMTDQQKQQMKELATQIAMLNLGAGATQEAVVNQLKNIYSQYKITANLTAEMAQVKINELGAAVKAIHDQRMAQQQQAQQQSANTGGDMFAGFPTEDIPV